MQALELLPSEDAERIRIVAFDLDDTLLTRGRLTREAYDALSSLHDRGVKLVGCTGRPAGWAEVLAPMWPVDLFVSENGGVCHKKDASGKLRTLWGSNEGRASLLQEVSAVMAKVPNAEFADDNVLRWTDTSTDVGEHHKLAPAEIEALVRAASARGLHTIVSSVHLHCRWGAVDKGTGTLRALEEAWGISREDAIHVAAFIGDSGNDAPAFETFVHTFAVSNVRDHLDKLRTLPRWVALEPMGKGFAAIAAKLGH